MGEGGQAGLEELVYEAVDYWRFVGGGCAVEGVGGVVGERDGEVWAQGDGACGVVGRGEEEEGFGVGVGDMGRLAGVEGPAC